MNTTSEELLKNILTIRQIKGFSQEYMAENLGKKQATYSLIERGIRQMDYSLLCKIAGVFECDVIDIITYPYKYVRADGGVAAAASAHPAQPADKVTLQIELQAEKREQVLKLVLGDNK